MCGLCAANKELLVPTRVARSLISLRCITNEMLSGRAFAFEQACKYGLLRVVKTLLADADLPMDRSFGLRLAIENGHTQVVQALLLDGRVDPCASSSASIRLAGDMAELETLRVLLADGRANPAAHGDQAINNASRRGYVRMVRVLLADGRAGRTSAIRVACVTKHVIVARACVARSAWFASAK